MNNRIQFCPRCAQRSCACVERTVADALAEVGTGVINVDILGGSRWISSMRRHERTAFIELKRLGEPMGDGQRMCLLDLTGQLWTCSGFALHQRSFVIRQTSLNAFTLSTFSAPLGEMKLIPLIENVCIDECVRVIQTWMRDGCFKNERAGEQPAPIEA